MFVLKDIIQLLITCNVYNAAPVVPNVNLGHYANNVNLDILPMPKVVLSAAQLAHSMLVINVNNVLNNVIIVQAP